MEITKAWIQQICSQKMIPFWNEMPDTFPDFLEETDAREKEVNEKFLNRSLLRIQKKIAGFPSEPEMEERWKMEMDAAVTDFLAGERILGIIDTLGENLFAEFERSTKKFVQRTRGYDTGLGMPEIWQALRNYFIYAVITDFQGEKQNCKDPVFAYSLLYPYTDNFIDSAARSRDEKKHYNQMIKAMLEGKEYQPINQVEERTSELLLLIRDFYGIEKWIEVSKLLLLMLEAQEESICQQNLTGTVQEELPDWDDILRISAYKGSISVLNDYAFAAKELCLEEVVFYLHFGFLLQLADDLQDIFEDQKEGSHTVMTMALESGRLERMVNRLLHFTYRVMGEFQPKNPALKEFAKKNCQMMILSTVLTNHSCFSTEYLAVVEKYLPISRSFFEKMQRGQMQRVPDGPSVKERQMHIVDIMVR